ncbi:hypothetical protein [Siphonobacter aquaeclarae]|uniref:Uncharacterized protein n=1 Tax=Siphonobacter aquaeclarae TaxID=563176 RepID=A0A1G9WBT6_9BACT|nr:hypothetical protein [Siphonobacter aquaeclarae]SDM82008.1 hypothetical protein SAMN04488090_4326 [Siphonobacter aquaeclarae]
MKYWYNRYLRGLYRLFNILGARYPGDAVDGFFLILSAPLLWLILTVILTVFRFDPEDSFWREHAWIGKLIILSILTVIMGFYLQKVLRISKEEYMDYIPLSDGLILLITLSLLVLVGAVFTLVMIWGR